MAIAIIGIMSSITLVFISQPQRAAIMESVDRKNAAMVVSMAVCASGAGANPVVDSDVEATVRKLMIGVIPETGAFRGRRFVVSGITEENLPGVVGQLQITGHELALKPAN
ncbi:MAG: hypothetical protein JNM99_05060 [Verrucomicrobiaceae bacterium]|nr:hypothetical protein [Verrucomicrobiaceae bacterium]